MGVGRIVYGRQYAGVDIPVCRRQQTGMLGSTDGYVEFDGLLGKIVVQHSGQQHQSVDVAHRRLNGRALFLRRRHQTEVFAPEGIEAKVFCDIRAPLSVSL